MAKVNGVEFIPAIRVGRNKVVNSRQHGFYLHDVCNHVKYTLTKEEYLDLVTPLHKSLLAFGTYLLGVNSNESLGAYYRRMSKFTPASFKAIKEYYHDTKWQEEVIANTEFIANPIMSYPVTF